MAASYALPVGGGSHHGRAHSHSFLTPDTSSFPSANGNSHHVRKAASSAGLYTHNEASQENTPFASPIHEHNHSHMFANGNSLGHDHSHSHGHSHSHSHSPMRPSLKGRARGESDLGRPADPHNAVYKPTLETIHAPAASTSWFSLPEALTALLIPLPYMLASAAYSSTAGASTEDGFPPLSAYSKLKQSVLTATSELPLAQPHRPSGIVEACTLASGTLLLVGFLAKIRASERVLDRRKEQSSSAAQLGFSLNMTTARSLLVRALSIGLPFYAAMKIGGMRTGLVLLAAIAANIACVDSTVRPSIRDTASQRLATVAVMSLSAATDLIGWTVHAPMLDLILGYLALAVSVFLVQPPLPTLAAASTSRPSSKATTPTTGYSPWSRSAASPLICSAADTNLTVVAGVLMSLVTVAASMFLSKSPSLATSAITLSTLSVALTAFAILFSQPSTLRSESKAGLGLGCFLAASCAFLFSPSLWPGTVCNGGLSALAFVGVLYDTSSSKALEHAHDHTTTNGHSHHQHDTHHHHPHPETARTYSAFTGFILARCETGSLVHSILIEKDSRRIAYFTCLNFCFMIVQGLYGYLSGSLGLLSDTVHMFFDCLGLVVGLGAAVASKWPTSPEKPYGWGKLNTLAGFGNGIFLMLVSVEFIWEAIEGMAEGRELRRVKELLVVSTLGLLVNMVGLLAFGHAHAGHDHGHDHGHSHGHSHSHSKPQANGHAHGPSHDHSQDHAHDDHAHDDHDGHNENMHGIYLHVAADAGGSLAVIISTAMTLWKPWYLWDPLATIIIAVLIFGAAVPLVTSSGQKLLLVIPDDLEYNIKNTLQELGELRGVVGYAVPRFWLDEKVEDADAHAHGHDHGGHGHEHGHSHEHHDHEGHSHDHSHDHHGHDHSSHAHDHSNHAHDHDNPPARKQRISGVIHVIAAYNADLDDVRERVDELVKQRNMDLVIQVEREGEQCWCGSGQK